MCANRRSQSSRAASQLERRRDKSSESGSRDVLEVVAEEVYSLLIRGDFRIESWHAAFEPFLKYVTQHMLLRFQAAIGMIQSHCAMREAALERGLPEIFFCKTRQQMPVRRDNIFAG